MFRAVRYCVLLLVAAFVVLCGHAPASAGLIIDATFSGFTASEQAAIQAAINVVESDIANPITVNIGFQTMSSGLGESDSYLYGVSYYDYYNAVKAVATTPAQLSAIASLGAPPTPGSGNP